MTLLVEQDESTSEPRLVAGTQWDTATLKTARSVKASVDAAFAVYAGLGTAVERFALMKNLGRRILDLEHFARGQLLGMMRLQYERTHIWEHPLWDRPLMHWRIRGWRKRSRVQMARLWVVLTAIEELRRGWTDARRFYVEEIDRIPTLTLLFAIDDNDDADNVSSLDTSPIQRGITEAGDRIDRGALVRATFWVALAAIVGVVVGRLL